MAVHARADFDGDGFGDLAVRKHTMPSSVPEWGGNLGLVQVLYGTATGFRTEGGQQWSRADLATTGSDPDAFGQALAHGDFDGDGFSDLVIGDPGATEDGWGRGEVRVLFGSATGLATDRMQTWTMDSPGVDLPREVGDGFGYALTVGDLGRGPEADLAVGAPGHDGSGAVLVLFGGAAGLSAQGHQLWRQGSDGLPGSAQRDDDFGAALIAGDFDGGGFDELVIGVRYDTIAGVEGAGSVQVLRGTAAGLTAEGNQHWRVGAGGIKGRPGETDLFGGTFAVGRFSASGHLDLVVGKPGWSSADTGGAGAVHVLYGTADGLSARGNQIWDEYALGTRELNDSQPEDSPLFGTSLAAADFGHGPQDDLVIGVPESLTPGWGSGSILVLYGTATGLSAKDSRQISEVTRGIQGFDDDEALFGSALAVLGPVPAGAHPTLAVSAPWYGGRDEEDRSGVIHLIRGSAAGLTAAGDAVLQAKQFPQQPVGDGFGFVMTS